MFRPLNKIFRRWNSNNRCTNDSSSRQKYSLYSPIVKPCSLTSLHRPSHPVAHFSTSSSTCFPYYNKILNKPIKIPKASTKGSNDTLKTVQAILATVPNSEDDSLAFSNTSEAEMIEYLSLPKLEPTTLPADGESTKLEPTSATVPIFDAIPKFSSPETALEYLSSHAHKYLLQTKNSHKNPFISRDYLIQLIRKLLDWKMYRQASSLFLLMQTSDFRPPQEFVDFFNQKNQFGQLEHTISTIEELQQRNKPITKNHLVSLFRPYLRSQDHAAVEKIYSALKEPSTVACNILIKSLLAQNRVRDALSLLTEMVNRGKEAGFINHRKGKKIFQQHVPDGCPDSHTFAFLMHHFRNTKAAAHMDSTMSLMKSIPYVEISSFHYAMYIETLSSSHQHQKAIATAQNMLDAGISDIEEHVAATIIYSCLNSRWHKLAVDLHYRMEAATGKTYTSLRYCKALILCMSYLGNRYRDDMNAIMSRISEANLEKVKKTLQASLSISDSPAKNNEPGSIINIDKIKGVEDQKITFIMIPSLCRMDQVSKAVQIYKSQFEKHPYNDTVLTALLKTLQDDSKTALEISKMTQEKHHRLSISAYNLTMSAATNPDTIFEIWSWVKTSKTAPNENTLTELMRSSYLQASQPLTVSTRLSEIARSALSLASSFKTLHGISIKWNSASWLLRTLYIAHQPENILNLLSELLPTSQQLLSAPAMSTVVPLSIALDFYAWCLKLAPDKTLVGIADILAELQGPERRLTPTETRQLLTVIQLVKRSLLRHKSL